MRVQSGPPVQNSSFPYFAPKRRFVPTAFTVRPVVILLLLIAIIAFGSQPARGASNPTQIKAVWLFKFLSYATWPPEAFQSKDSPFVLGILGENPFGTILDPVTSKKVRNRPIELKDCKSVEDAKKCHVLFISSSEQSNLVEIFRDLQESNVLTVGETPDFTSLGGVINLTYGQKSPLQISTGAMARAKIKLHSKLQELSQLVP